MALFPPIVASSMPAFAVKKSENSNQKINNSVNIYFTLSEYGFTQIENIATVHVSVRNQASNVSLISNTLGNILVKNINEQTNEDKALNRYSITINDGEDLEEPFEPGSFYKIQLRFSSVTRNEEQETVQSFFTDNIKYFSEWSTVCIIKPILAPNFYIDEFYYGEEDSIYRESQTNNFYYNFADFTGVYSIEDSDEILKSWRLRLLNDSFDQADDNNYLYIDNYTLVDSGWTLNNANNYSLNTDGVVLDISLPYQFKEEMDQNRFKLLFEIKTYNDYYQRKVYAFQYYYTNINQLKPVQSDESGNITVNEEQGYIKIEYHNSKPITGNLIFRRKDSIKEVWEDLRIFQSHNEQDYYYYDFTPQSGIKYTYLIQQKDARGRRGQPQILGEVIPEWEHAFLLERCQQNKKFTENEEQNFLSDVKQLKLKYDFQISSYKTNISENKTDTIGSKYPYIRRNGNMYYRSFPITGTITHYMDNVDFFTNTSGMQNEIKKASKQDYFNTQYDYIYERRFREQVEKFLYNMKPKLYKSTQEGNILIKLMQVSLTPKAELDRLIYTFSATAYEIDEPSIANLDKHGIISLGIFNPVVIFDGQKIGQLTSFKSEDQPLGNIFKAGQDIIGVKDFAHASENSIARKELYKVGVEGKVLDNFQITSLRLTIESQPYLIIKQGNSYRPFDDIDDKNNPFTGATNITTSTDDIDFGGDVVSKLYQLEESYFKKYQESHKDARGNTVTETKTRQDHIYLGTLFEINGKQIIVSYPNNIYELKEDFLKLPSTTTIIPLKDTAMSVDYTIKTLSAEDLSNLPKRITVEKRLGQIYGVYSSSTNLVKEIINKYNLSYSELNNSTGKLDIVFNKVSSFTSISFDTEPNAVFQIQFLGASDKPTRFVINETGELTLDSNVTEVEVVGLNISSQELRRRTETSRAQIKYPVHKDLVIEEESGDSYIYYKKAWRKATLIKGTTESYDIRVPIEVMLFYIVSVESDYF